MKDLALIEHSLTVPESREIAQKLTSRDLFRLEAIGAIATEILDERVTEWAEQGWSQQAMANELGCSAPAINKRLKRLGVKTEAALRGEGRPSINPVNTNPVGSRKINEQTKLVEGIVEKARLIEQLSPHLDFNVIKGLEAEDAWKQQLQAARTVLSRIIAAL